MRDGHSQLPSILRVTVIKMILFLYMQTLDIEVGKEQYKLLCIFNSKLVSQIYLHATRHQARHCPTSSKFIVY